MNSVQPHSGGKFQLQTKILTEDNPQDLERIVNDYLEILASGHSLSNSKVA